MRYLPINCRARECKLTRNYENVPVLLPVVSPMSTGAVADRETRRLFADLLVLSLILVHLGYRILHALLLQSLRQFGHGKPRCAAHDELLQRVVYEFVLFLSCRTRERVDQKNNLTTEITLRFHFTKKYSQKKKRK